MLTTVYASAGGRAFHGDPDCRAFRSGQDLNDWDCGCDEYCRHRSPHLHVAKPISIPNAMGDGKLPCLVCMPGLGTSWFQTPSEDDFGHVPVEPAHPGGFGGLQNGVCARCTERGVSIQFGGDDPEPLRIVWPCVSAFVLGLVARPGTCPDCRHPMDKPAPGSTKCPDCDHNDRIDALGSAL